MTTPSEFQPRTPEVETSGWIQLEPDATVLDQRRRRRGRRQRRRDWRKLFRRTLEVTPGWVISLGIHSFFLAVLALIVAEAHRAATSRPTVEVISDEVYAEQLGQQLIDPSANPYGEELSTERMEEPIRQVEAEAKTEVAANEQTLDTPSNELTFDPLAAANALPIAPARDASNESRAVDERSIQELFSGRKDGNRDALHAAYGGTKMTQESVELALEWLARQQTSDGMWSLQGPYPDGGMEENRIAATAMALLAYFGNGQTHQSPGKHQKVIERALTSFLEKQNEQGAFWLSDAPPSHRLYTHAQCTIAICELYGMTRDERLRAPAEQAINYCLRSQSPEGGWRYNPGYDADTSVTGWFVMALQSARMAGLKVPQPSLERIGGFLDLVAIDGGSRYTYQPHDRETLAMTAEGLLARQYLGWSRDDSRLIRGLDYLNQYRVTYESPDVYYWYYGTQVMHHMGGQYWHDWNQVMRQAIPEQQSRTGRNNGSWNPSRDEWGKSAGRLFVTCLSTYILEVYYRHLPLYRDETTAMPRFD